MIKEGSVVSKVWTMFIYNLEKAQNDSEQPLWAPKKYPQKMIKRGFFL